MDITIFLNDNSQIQASGVDYNAAEYAIRFNDQRVLMINIGDMVINKNHVKMIAPTPTPTL